MKEAYDQYKMFVYSPMPGNMQNYENIKGNENTQEKEKMIKTQFIESENQMKKIMDIEGFKTDSRHDRFGLILDEESKQVSK
jgi:hypothetical protein